MDLSTYLEGLLQKSSIPQSELKHFLNEMRITPSGPLITSKLLVAKIQSVSETQALRAFDLLEAALSVESEGSIEFRTEIGRYRFLNELIRVLSPKFYAAQTIPAVKERAIKFLTTAAGSKRRQWFPSEHSKIDAVYNSLVDGGIIQPTAVDPDAEFQKSIFERGENAILLKKLLQSKDPADLQAANRLIKKLVDVEAKRNERRSEIHSLIDQIETSTSLLTEMCMQPIIDREIVDDLAACCQTLRNKLGQIGTETNEETSSFLHASDNIEKALEFYQRRKCEPTLPNSEVVKPPLTARVSLEVAKEKEPSAKLSLADELLVGLNLEAGSEQSSTNELASRVTFRNEADTSSNLLNFDDDPDPNSRESVKSETASSLSVMAENKRKGLDELGVISRQLMEQSLGRNIFQEITEVRGATHKVTLNQLQKQSAPAPVESKPIASREYPRPLNSASMHLSLLDLDFLEKPRNASEVSQTIPISPALEDEKILHFDEDVHSDEHNRICDTESLFCFDTVKDLDLENIEILEDVNPLVIPLVTESSNGNGSIEVSFTFGTFPDFPSAVKLSVITVANRNPTWCLSDYSFQLLPPKGVKVKLFPPSSTELGAWKKRFLSPPLLTQVALILVPVDGREIRKEIKIKFILSCYLGEETALFNSEFVLPSFYSTNA